MKGILGKKVGMTQVFTEEGKLIPVTVISVEPNVVTQIKKANTEPKRFLREIRGVNVNDYKIGDTLTANIFEVGDVIDITGISKGKGFQGSIKRHNFARGPMSHGSQYHRGVGSLGTLRPMRVFKGTELPGHMGAELTTIQNSVIVDVIEDENVILVKGNVPGPKKGLVIVKSAIKNKDKKIEMANLINYTKEEKVEEVAEENSAESQE